MIAELGEIGGVLCVERLLDLVRRGGLGPADSIAAFLMPYLASGEVRLVAEVSPAELDACRRLLPGLTDLFQMVPVRPFTPAKAVAVIDRRLRNVGLRAGPEDRTRRRRADHPPLRSFQPYAVFPGQASVFARE